MKREMKVVSFYSFKGGAGRTLCAANLVGILARELGLTEQNRMLLMDMDTDSAGLTILMKQLLRYESASYSAAKLVLRGDPDLTITDDCQAFFESGTIDVSGVLGAPVGSVRFLGTEIAEGDETAPTEGSETRMRYFASDCLKNDISTIVVDAASGRQETALLCHMVSDVIVYCCRLTNQFLIGTENHLRSFINTCKEKRDEDDQPHVILVPVAVPEVTDGTPSIWKNRKQYALGCLEGLLGLSDRIHLAAEIGEVQAFKWIESVLCANNSVDSVDEEKALGAYLDLAKLITGIIESV